MIKLGKDIKLGEMVEVENVNYRVVRSGKKIGCFTSKGFMALKLRGEYKVA